MILLDCPDVARVLGISPFDLLRRTANTKRRVRQAARFFVAFIMARDFAKQFYNSKEWEKMRAYILMRDRYRCTQCGSASELEVHHIKQLTPANINDASVTLNDKNLKTLCRECHFKEHVADKLNGTKEHNALNARSDCDSGFAFDANGYLVPVAK